MIPNQIHRNNLRSIGTSVNYDCINRTPPNSILLSTSHCVHVITNRLCSASMRVRVGLKPGPHKTDYTVKIQVQLLIIA